MHVVDAAAAAAAAVVDNEEAAAAAAAEAEAEALYLLTANPCAKTPAGQNQCFV